MNKIKIKFAPIFLFALLLFLPAAAKASDKAVYDDAALLSTQQAGQLEERAAELEKETGFAIILATTADTGGKSAQTYGEDLFEQVGTGDHGVVGIIDMENREIALVTTGDAIYYLTDDRIDKILDQAYEAISGEDYGNTFMAMVLGIEDAYRSGIPHNQYIYDEDSGKIIKRRFISQFELLLALLGALAVGGGTIAVIVGKYRLKWGGYKFSYREHSRLELRQKEDQFINQTIHKRRIPKNPPGESGGGRSSTHSGSSGRSFGGDSRKF